MIEVEVKFSLESDQEQKVTSGAEFIGEKVIHDIYYDYADFHLTLKDWWLRQRDGQFELKKSLDPPGFHKDHQSQRYIEIARENEIMPVLNITGQNLAAALAVNKIKPFATIKTKRRTYHQGQFHIDIDRTNSGFQLGEIEILVASESEIAAAEASILKFLAEKNIPPNQSQNGKLENFLAQNSPGHFSLLVKAGVIDPQGASVK